MGSAPIVVGVDGSERALRAVHWAALAAARYNAPLRLLHSTEFADLFVGATIPPPPGYQDFLRKRGWKQLRHAARLAESVAKVDPELDVVPDLPVPYLAGESEKARMVVVGASGHGQFTGLFAGSTAVTLAAHAHCPVVIVRAEPALS
jgi:nucleotide-binding universal stress UspA family protein